MVWKANLIALLIQQECIVIVYSETEPDATIMLHWPLQAHLSSDELITIPTQQDIAWELKTSIEVLISCYEYKKLQAK